MDNKKVFDKLEFASQIHQQCSGSDQDAANCRLYSEFFMQENKRQHKCDNYGQLWKHLPSAKPCSSIARKFLLTILLNRCSS